MKASANLTPGWLLVVASFSLTGAAWLGWRMAESQPQAVLLVKATPPRAILRASPSGSPLSEPLTMEQKILTAQTSDQFRLLCQGLLRESDSASVRQHFSLLWNQWFQVDERQAVDAARGLPTPVVLSLVREVALLHPETSLEPLAIALGLDPRLVADSAHGSGRLAILSATVF
jgi:hypothetical protein